MRTLFGLILGFLVFLSIMMMNQKMAHRHVDDVTFGWFAVSCGALVFCTFLATARRRRLDHLDRHEPAPEAPGEDEALMRSLLAGLDRMENRVDNLETILSARRSPASLNEKFERLQRGGN